MQTYIYRGSWMFVDKIRIKVNDQIYDFPSTKEIRNTLNGGYIEELNYYDVDRDFIEKMVSASSVLIRISGQDAYLDVEYKPEHNQLLKQFLAKTK